MAILENEVWVTVNSMNMSYYSDLGYDIPKRKYRGVMTTPRGTKILVNIEDLHINSHIKVTKVCDDCGEMSSQEYKDVIRNRNDNKFKDDNDRCRKCAKINEGNIHYGRYANSENCIANTDVEFAKLFWNNSDTHMYTCASSKKADFKCPHCNSKVVGKAIRNVYNQGLSCSYCSDGVSYPEKFVANVLSQLNIEFEAQKSFEWIKDKRFDFYIESFNCIIEVHGKQHYIPTKFSGTGRTFQEEQRNDYAKKDVGIR